MFPQDFISWYPEISDPRFGQSINDFQEFRECALGKDTEKIDKVKHTLLNHQIFVSRFLSLATPYDGLLLFHEMGTGKTCSAIAAVEQIKNQFPNQFRGALILARGFGLINNFINEIALKCTDGRYLPKDLDVSDKLFKMRMKKKIEEFYTFETFERFSKNIRDVSPHILCKRFENFVIVIDEVHNIRDKTQDISVYESVHRFLHLLKNKRVILMSGTPMKDGCEEIASVMNLLLPQTAQLPTDVKFLETFFQNGDLKNIHILKKSFAGRVSFLKSKISNVEKIEKGSLHQKLQFLKTVSLVPSEFQKNACNSARILDLNTSNIYTQSRQASLFVFPDGSCGKAGWKKWSKNSSFWQNLKSDNVRQTLQNIQNYSAKYAYVIEKCITAEEKGEISFIYSDIVNGSGLLVLAKLLELCGFTRRVKEKKSFVVLTSAISESEKSSLMKICNASDNWDGSKISVILGSRVMMEGFTFNNIRHEHILTPHWNFSETSQIIARGWRIGSHRDLEQQNIVPTVSVYKYVLDMPNSIDILMYSISEKKDVGIKKITQVLQESAVDCFLNKERNKIQGFDYERECNYTKCDYTCDADSVSPNVSITNYEHFYFKDSKLWVTEIKKIKYILSKIFFVHIDEICDRSRLALSILLHCRENSVQFVNPVGCVGYLQNVKEIIFLSTTPGGYTPCDDFPTSGRPQFSNIVLQATNKNMLSTLGLFLARKMSKESTFESLRTFPTNIQQLLVEKCCKAQIEKQSKKLILRQHILDYFETLYTIADQSFGVFFVNQQFFTKDKKWRKATPEEISKIISKRNSDLSYIHNNDKGFYGQENRQINEFCIRHVTNSSETDKRKIQSGRRCVNWNKNDLVNLANKLIGPNDWNDKSRSEMCITLQKWFKENNLIEQDLTCGLQTKKKDFQNVNYNSNCR